MTSTKPDFDALLAQAHALANRASSVILPRFRAGVGIAHKGGSDFDPVTEADKEAERVMRALINERFPDHGIIGEEFGSENEDAEYCWVLDPIDGTRAFIMGQPLWGVLIGLAKDGAPYVGMMEQPFLGERFWAADGKAIYRRGETEKLMRTRACADLADALLGATGPYMFEEWELARFDELGANVRLKRYGGDCYNYCLLAMGEVDLVVEASLNIYDILPLIPIVEAAGGVVTTWEGGDPAQGGRIIAAGDPALHEKALRYLNP
ncbi:histidinol-phosphatase [Methyloligella halotolerans]|uniref:histidinol-phosphatase n=1 Tax=Methyloligella halotolerans TaxID=1177755 RepID=UPI00083E14B4|nr:histidinol-phosphatase [Methyloligella halotolerans]